MQERRRLFPRRATFRRRSGSERVKTFLKISLIVLVAVAVVVFGPGLVGPLCGGLAALTVVLGLMLLALVLALCVGGAALLGLLIGVLVAALVVVAVLSPVWVPALVVIGFVVLLTKLTGRRGNGAHA